MKEVRIVAPSCSIQKKDNKNLELTRKYFKKLGYQLTLGKYIYDQNTYFGCSSIQNRVNDLMDAFKDSNVAIILCANGGYNINQILPYLDYEIIKNNPKMIIGYSDITALLLSIFTKTNLITYYGPMISSFSLNNSYIQKYFEKILNQEKFMVNSSTKVIDYTNENNQRRKVIIPNSGMNVIQNGTATGKIIGGNLCTFNLLQGTEYMPNLDEVILFIEDDADDFTSDAFFLEFDRNLESLLQAIKSDIKGLVLGRFQLCSGMTIDKIKEIIKNKEKLKDIPILINVDFGHTNPMLTIPLGGTCYLNLDNDNIEIKIS